MQMRFCLAWMMFGLAGVGIGHSATARAQGTRLWSIGRYDELERGTLDGVAIRSDGGLMPGPSVQHLGDATLMGGASYVWSVAAGADGVSFAGLGGSSAGSAAVLRIGADGKSSKIFSGKELGVQAVLAGSGGSVFVATAPDGKVYRVEPDGRSTVVFDPSTTAEKPKYLWALALHGDQLYVAAGSPAAVYAVDLKTPNTARLLFKTQDLHVRCVTLAADGSLWAGTDGSGVVYRLAAKNGSIAPGTRPIAIFAAEKREITALTVAPDGSATVASVGSKGVTGSALQPLPVTGQVGVSVSFSQPGATPPNPVVPEGSQIDRIAPDGTPSHLLTLKDDVVYALAMHDGAVFAATGNHGHLYRIDAGPSGRFADVAHLEASQVSAMAETPGGLLLGASNSAALYRVRDTQTTTARYTSEVFDAQQFAAWGRVEAQYPAIGGRAPGFTLSVRTGNVPNPIEGWTDWVTVSPNASGNIPAGRFAQWRVEFPAASKDLLSSVGLNYLPRNAAPVVDDIAVQLGARVQPTPPPSNPTVQIVLPKASSGGPTAISLPTGDSSPLSAQKDRSAVTVRWSAHDDNGDDLLFSVWYRGAGEQTWRLLKDNLTDRFYSFDASLLPDGTYTMQVRVSDRPEHPEAEALTQERESDSFTLDATPPVPGPLTAKLEAGKLHVTFSAKDALSPIAHAEYSVDAGPWQYTEPVGHLSDSLEERYDFTASLPKGDASNEHVVAVRVYDRFENVVSVKAVIR